MANFPGWKSVEQTWSTKLSNQAVPRDGTPPESCLLMSGREETGSYIESIIAQPYGVTGSDVIVHLWAKPKGQTDTFLLGSSLVNAVFTVTLGSATYYDDLSNDLLPLTSFPLADTNDISTNRILKVGPGVSIYVGLDKALSPAGIAIWAHGGHLGNDDLYS